MADTDKDAEKEVTAPLSVKKPEIKKDEPKAEAEDTAKKPEAIGEDDVTAKIPRPVISDDGPKVTLGSAAKNDDAEPLKPKSSEEEQTAKLPKMQKPILKPVEDKKEPDAIPLKKPESGEEDQTAKIPKPGGDRKVVLNSATDSTIKPSDATTMAPAFIPDSIDMKQTESGNVAVVDGISPAVSKEKTATPPPIPASPGSSQGRKTIKLKPLKKDAPAEEEENTEETISMSRDSLLEDENMPSLGGNAAETTSEKFEDEATVKIQKPDTTKPAHPTPIVPGSKETIKLRPSTTPPPAGIAPAGITKTESAAAASDMDDDESEETVSVSKKTIRLVPKKPGEDDSTQKTPKAGPPSAKPSAPTVKLQEPDDVTQKTARPSAPTVKLPDESPVAAVAPPMMAAPTAAAPAVDEPPSASKKTLKLKATSPATQSPQAARGPGGGSMPPSAAPEEGGPAVGGGGGHAPKPKVAGADPGIVLTLVAVLTLLLVAYYAWMVGGQWAEQYMEVETANVPALSGKVK